MKKVGYVLLLFCFLLVGKQASAYAPWTEQFVSSFEQSMKPMPQSEKTKYLKLIQSILNAPQVKTTSNADIQLLVRELMDRTNTKLGISSQNPPLQIKASDGTSYQDMPNIDFEQVRNAWLGWHNDIRTQQGLQVYSYHSDLEKSAKLWADYLASIKQWTHKRNENDGYYNYTAIKDRLAGVGLKFPPESGGRAAFSESIGYRYYQCGASDCTQQLLDTTKKTFDGFVAEGKNGIHYKAMIMPHFKQMGVGFQFEPEKKMVYTVIHYAGDLLE